MGGWWKAAIAAAVLAAGMVVAAPLTAASSRPAPQSGAASADQVHACGAPAAHDAACGAIQLLFPSANWHPGPNAHAAKGKGGGGSGGTTPAPPSSGYYPGDLQSAYGLGTAAAAFEPGPNAPTVAIVDAYNDPYAATDLAAYRASLSKATDPATGIADATIPPLCPSNTSTGCVTFTKVNQSGGTSYPRASASWSEEISVDLDMISAICPDCNIVLVEASSASFSSLATAVTYAKSLNPAAVTNSYGGSEFSSESTYNSIYSAGTSTAVTVASGDSGYGVQFPAASPGVTAVGGTSLTYSGSGSGLTWNLQTVWSTAGSGCSAYEGMPAWQKDTGVYYIAADCNGRQVADVAAVADPSTGVAVYDTYHEPGWMVFGGTSVSAQILGGIYGLAAGAGNLDPSSSALYPDSSTKATGETPGLVPVTSGKNGSCGDYLCNATDALSSGYNGPTGLGTPEGTTAFTATTSSTAGSLSFTPTSLTTTAGAWSGPFTVDLTKAAPIGGLAVTLSTTSSTGEFSTSASGITPTHSLTVTIPSGATKSEDLYYYDTTAGTPTVTAAATGWTSASLSVTVKSASLESMSVTVTAGAPVKKGPNYHVPLTVTATGTTTNGTTVPLTGAAVSLEVFAGSKCSGNAVATGTGKTNTNGTAAFTFTTRKAGTWCALATVTASGYSPGAGTTTFST